MRPTQLIWSACGSPAPFDMDGVPIKKAKGAGDQCALCGGCAADYHVDEFVSNTFYPTRNLSRLAGFGGENYCAACVFCARTLRLRCVSWFASEIGFAPWLTRREKEDSPNPDSLLSLLSPPAPPFVVAVPLYGIEHGGENHWRRTPWPDNLQPDNALKRLQSKHVAIYARVAYSRDRYPVQVDDALDFVLDRDLWLRLRDAFASALAAAVTSGVPPYPAKMCLRDMRAPRGISPALARDWARLTSLLSPHTGAPWWNLFCELYPTPEKEEKTHATKERTSPTRYTEEPQISAPSACLPAAGVRLPYEPKQTWKGQILLPF